MGNESYKNAGFPEFRHQRFGFGNRPRRNNRDSSFGGQAAADAFADPLRAAGDDDDFSFQLQVHSRNYPLS